MKNSYILENFENVKNNQNSFSSIVANKIKAMQKSKNNNENIVMDIYEIESLDFARKLDSLSSRNKFAGVTFLLKDNINYLDKVTTSGSKIMERYISTFNATIVENIQKNNGIILGKVNLDELGHAGTGTCSAFGNVKNPLDHYKVTGGSSSGSVAAVKLGLCDIAIGTDTGDSIRHPASFLGLVGFKPSYGLVSRFGVTPYASSLDHVGVIAKTVTDAAIGIDMIKGFDPKDFTSVDLGNKNFSDELKITSQKYKILILSDVVDELHKPVKSIYDKFINDLKEFHNVEFINFDHNLLKILSPLYGSISFTEGYTNWNNVSGILFGNRNFNYKNYEDLLIKTRNNFGHEVKNRYVISNLFNNSKDFSHIYENSIKIRRIIVNRINELLNKCDAILIPSSSSFAYSLKDVIEKNIQPNCCDDALMIANFAGLPSISIPLTSEHNKHAFDINLMGLKYSDEKLLNIAFNLETLIKEKGYYDK